MSRPASGFRLTWVDATRGVSIMWIVIFHFFGAYSSTRYPWPLNVSSFPSFWSDCGPTTFTEGLGCVLEGLIAALIQRGPNAVGVFIVMSGFGLTYGVAKTGGPQGGWGKWYTKRLLRLFPMYWAAHLLYLVSPFLYRQDPIDYRFLLSAIGDRILPVDKMFYYLVPAWWFVGLLIQLYIVFPLLFRLLQKLNPVKFFALCCTVTVLSRYLFFGVMNANGNYVQGAFFACRLWEFAAGMVLAYLYRQRPSSVEGGFFSIPMLMAGVALYTLGVFSYQPGFFYAFSDGLIGMGLFVILSHATRWADRVIPVLGSVLTTVGVYSYGLYLVHQPYVIHFGHELRGYSLWGFLSFGFIVVTGITAGAIVLERQVNGVSKRLFGKAKEQP